jgi:hypothetical protein
VVPVDPVALGAEFGLSGHERTRTDRHYSPEHLWSRTLGWIMLPAAVVLAPVAVVALLSSDPAAFATGLILAPLLACLGVVSAWLIRRARPERVDQTFLYADGVLQLAGGEPEPRVVRWDDAVSLSVRMVRPDESDAYIGSSTVRDRAGNEVTARGPALPRRVAEILTPRMVPALLDAFDRGEPVSFGPVRIDGRGITVSGSGDGSGGRFVAWADMRRITIDARTGIDVRTADRKVRLRIDLDDDIPGAFFAHYVVERGATRAGAPVEYQQERHLPPRAATRPAIG